MILFFNYGLGDGIKNYRKLSNINSKILNGDQGDLEV